MLNEIDLREFLDQRGISISGIIVPSFDTEASFVFINITRDKENRQHPSNLALSAVKRELSEGGTTVEFLFVDSSSQDIEAGLRATLRHSFDKEIRNTFLSWEGKKGKIWIEPKYAYGQDVEASLAEKASIYLSQMGIEIDSIVRTTGENIPTMLACLYRVRHLSPASETELRTDLIARGFSVPSVDWLRRRLDTMRRAGKVVRLADGSYALTLSSLRALGTTKGRNSLDITRMLALARRG